MSLAENFYSKDSCCGKVDMGNRELDNVQKAELKHLFDNSEKRMSSEHFYRVFRLTGPTQKSHFYCPFQS